MHNKPVHDPSFPVLVTYPRYLGEPESSNDPAKKHSHLHQRQVLPSTVSRSVREREESSRVVLSNRRISAEPSFWQERIWFVEVSWVSMNAVRVKDKLSLFWNDPAQFLRVRPDQIIPARSTYRLPSTFVPLPFPTVRCEPPGTGG